MTESRLGFLLNAYIYAVATTEEQDEFFELVRRGVNDPELGPQLEQFWQQYHTTDVLPPETANVIFQNILKDSIELEHQPGPIINMGWRRITAAAAIIILLLTTGYFFLFNKSSKQSSIVESNSTSKDVSPPRQVYAKIRLADGKEILLDSFTKQSSIEQQNVILHRNESGDIIYETTGGAKNSTAAYNTFFNPRGSKVATLILSDGSRVWLNAGSSVTYPVAFIGNERKVFISGEAYFEVVHNASKPFYVTKGEVQVEVLGTHFNINAYDDEADIKVTLLEGSVKVSRQSAVSGRQSTVIKPGEQMQVGTGLEAVKNVDVDEVMAWKNGLFEFNNSSIETVMRQLSRWYDVEVIYEEKPTKIFKGSIPRNMTASNVMKVLEETGGVHFMIEGRKIIVRK